MDESRQSIHRPLLESGHHKLNQQFQLMQEKTSTKETLTTSDSERMTSFPAWGPLSDTYFFGSPFRSVLDYMGHAVHVSRAGSGEIIYLNGAAEQLYGYEDHEAFGQSVVKLLFDEEHRSSVLAIMGRLTAGESWSGQLPAKNRSGRSFLAIVCKSPLYEDGELVGIVTVSCDASVFNNTVSENTTTHQNHADERKSKFRGFFLKKIQPQVVALPEFQSISNLASKVLMRKRASDRESEEGEVESEDVRADKPPRVPIAAFGWNIGKNKNEGMSSEKEESTSLFAQPPKIAVKLLSKLQRGAISNSENEKNQQNGSEDNTITVDCEDASPRLQSSRNILSPSSSSKGNIDSKNVVVNSDIRWEDLKLKEEIGNGKELGNILLRDNYQNYPLGSFAVVYRAVWNGLDVAVKSYYGSQYSETILLDYKKEIGIMRKLRHPNVLLYMGAVCSEEKLAIVTEYLARGSLFRILHRGNQTLDMGRRLKMAIDVARGMNYLHHMNPPIVHRDLKSPNLLVDKGWTVKVGDFGLSKMKYATFLTAKSGRGTPQWMAPEVLRNEPSTEKSDIFSFGVILWELMTERIPWSDINPLQVVGVVGFMDGKLEIPEDIDPRVSTIISDCWRRNPDERPSFEDIMHKMTDLVTPKSASTP